MSKELEHRGVLCEISVSSVFLPFLFSLERG